MAAGLFAAGPAQATFHLMKIKEVFVMAERQYVELQMYQSGQQFVEGKQARFFDASNQPTGTYTFAADEGSGANQETILVANGDVETFFGVTADLDMGIDTPIPTPGGGSPGGKVCFVDPDPNPDDFIDCVAWGTYSGPAGSGGSAVGTPFNSAGARAGGVSGIPNGSAIERVTDGALDAGDDSGRSNADFEIAGTPSPEPNGGSPGGAPGGVISFSAASRTVDESVGSINVQVDRAGGTGTVGVSQALAPLGTAGRPSDLNSTDGTLSFATVPDSETFGVQIFDDSIAEPHETAFYTLTEPTGDAVLGFPLQIAILINDNDDVTAPETDITKPMHRSRYRPGQVRPLTGSEADDAALQEVFLALRQRIRGGGCKWWSGRRFVNRACSSKRFFSGDDLNGTQEDTWSHRLAQKLKPSVGRSRIANYTLYARSEDQQANQESTFEAGRNANTFEVT